MAKIRTDYINWVLTLNASQAQKSIHDLDEANKTLKESNKAIQAEMLRLVKANQAGTAAYQNLEKQLRVNKGIIDENKAKQQLLTSQLDKSKMSAAQLGKEVSKLRKELRNTSQALEPDRYKQLSEELERTEKAYQKAISGTLSFRDKIKSVSKVAESFKGALWSMAQKGLAGIVNAFKNAFNVIADFEAQQSKLAAIMQSTKEGIADMTEQARQLGATTSYTAGEVTSLQVELAKLGFVKEDIKAMTPEVLKFARAVDTDLGSAAALTGAALRIFGMNADETGRAVSAMAIGTTSSALSFSYLENVLATVGPVANSFGFTLEETTALLGQLANSGFDAFRESHRDTT